MLVLLIVVDGEHADEWKDKNLDFYVLMASPTGFELPGIEIRMVEAFVLLTLLLFLF